MTLDVIEADGVGDSRLLIQIHQIAPQILIVDNTSQIALKMAVINSIEPNECAKEPPVSLDNPVGKEITSLRQTLLKFVERLKKSATGTLVGRLARGETGSVDAVIDVVVKEIGELRVLGLDLVREKIQVFVPREVVKHGVEHRTDVVLAVIDDSFRYLVPEHGHRDALS